MLQDWDIQEKLFEDTETGAFTCYAKKNNQNFLLKISSSRQFEIDSNILQQHSDIKGLAYPTESLKENQSHILCYDETTPIMAVSLTKKIKIDDLNLYCFTLLHFFNDLKNNGLSHRLITEDDLFITKSGEITVFDTHHNLFTKEKIPIAQHLEQIFAIFLNIIFGRKDIKIEDIFSLSARHIIFLQKTYALKNIINFSAALKYFGTETPQVIINSESIRDITSIASIAHEFNTPLGICTSALSHLESSFSKITEQTAAGLKKSDLENFLEQSKQPLRMIKTNIQRTAKLSEKFRHLKSKKFYAEPLHVREFISDLFLGLESQFPTNKKIKLIYECIGQNKIKSYPLEITQILTNLIMNSIHHGFKTRLSGEIKVRTTITKSVLRIDYRDNGEGILPDNINQIFDTSFTTGSAKGRTGLGLSLIKDLIEEGFHGTITCTSEVSRGTHFILQLPHPL